MAAHDLHSFGNPSQVRVKHVALELKVDFEARRLVGTAALDWERQPDGPKDAPLVVDTRGLKIVSVTRAGVNGGGPVALAYESGDKPDPVLGTPLKVAVSGDTGRAVIAYETTEASTALQWLTPPQTSGKVHPFLFTQSQAIHARSWIPLQDSPGVRVTYEAVIRVPPGLRAVMSADAKGEDGGAFRFSMPQAIPSYLIALAVGDLAFQSLGDRTGVYAEPALIKKAAYEFAETEPMIRAAEKRYGPYRWGRYDLLVLPPSFPFGGMENAKLTFVTPTVLVGDRSLVGLIAHELAHSWSGNLVTNATWRDFWLNEGFTTYLERRITEDVSGKDQADMERVLGYQDLKDELARFKPRDQVLHIDLAGRDPDDGMTRIPYEKGALLLERLESQFGRERFDAFLKGYFDAFAFRSLTTRQFEDHLRDNLFPRSPKTADPVDLHTWIHSSGLPGDAPVPASAQFQAAQAAAQQWLDRKIAAKDLPYDRWGTLERVHFLRSLPMKLPAAGLAELDEAFRITASANAEVSEKWLLLAIRSGYRPADGRVEEFLTSIGRRKYLMPLYEALIQTPEGRTRAAAIFEKAKPGYHPIAVTSVAELLKSPKAKGSR